MAATGARFGIVVATLVIQIVLVVLLWTSVYPIASGASERTVVLVAIFGALAVFLAELATVFQGSVAALFLTRRRGRPRRRVVPDSAPATGK